MKQLIFVLLCAAQMSNSACAQKISADKVPAVVTSAFKTKFPAATKTKWEMEKGDYEANFNMIGADMSANFDNTGKWLETETEIKVAALPTAVSATLAKDFAGYKVNKASKVESVKNGSYYEAEVEKGEETLDVLLTQDGNVLSKTKEEEKGEKD